MDKTVAEKRSSGSDDSPLEKEDMGREPGDYTNVDLDDPDAGLSEEERKKIVCCTIQDFQECLVAEAW
jgi:hypothetical protein